MSEIYRNSTEYIYLDIHGDVADAPPTASLSVNNHTYMLPVTGPETANGAQRWSAVLSFAHTQEVGEAKVTWTFAIGGVAAKKIDFFDVVQPLANIPYIREELEIGDEISDEQIARTERRVRHIIENFTGQRFAPYEGTFLAVQTPDGSVRLPRRLLSLTSVGGVNNSLYYVIDPVGWSLAINYPRKRSGFRAGGMDAPTDPWREYRSVKATKVQVTGLWGYERVPTDITEAALILIEQQLCPDALYRERYLKTMTAADFRFEFDPSAYSGTGNVVADQILAKYATSSAALI